MIEFENITIKITGNDADKMPIGNIKYILDEFNKEGINISSIDIDRYDSKAFGNYAVSVTARGKILSFVKDRGEYIIDFEKSGIHLPEIKKYPQFTDVGYSLSDQLSILKQHGFFGLG